jgi:hypothetical protein
VKISSRIGFSNLRDGFHPRPFSQLLWHTDHFCLHMIHAELEICKPSGYSVHKFLVELLKALKAFANILT